MKKKFLEKIISFGMRLRLFLLPQSLFQNKEKPYSMTNTDYEKRELEIMEIMNRPYHKDLEHVIINLSDNLANIKQFYENKTQNEFQDDLYDLENLAKNLKLLFEYDSSSKSKRYSLEDKIRDANIITGGLSALIQKKRAYEGVSYWDIIFNARSVTNTRLSRMYSLFSIHNIPSFLQNRNLSFLIIGDPGSGKSTLLNELIKMEQNNIILLNQDLHDKNDCHKDISLFENACEENKNIYIDEMPYDFKEDLIKKYFIRNKNRTTNKIAVTYQRIGDIKDKGLISKFDLIITTKSDGSLVKHKELLYEKDLERLSFLSNWVLSKGFHYSAFYIKKDIK